MTGLSFPTTWWGLAIWALGVSLGIRVFLSFLRGLENPKDFSARFAAAMGGKHDHWNAFVLGSLELFSYPVLFHSGSPEYVGAWVGLKTLAGWKQWSEDRKHYTVFLIGNAFVLIASYAIAGKLP